MLLTIVVSCVDDAEVEQEANLLLFSDDILAHRWSSS